MNRHDAGKVFLTMRTLVVLDRSPFVLLLHVRAQVGGLSEPGNQMVKYIRFFTNGRLHCLINITQSLFTNIF